MMRIIISILLALCIAHVQGSEGDFSMSNLRDELILESRCLEKENLTMSDVQAFAWGENLEEAESKPQLKCFSACLFEHFEIMDNCDVKGDKTLSGMHETIMSCKGAVDAGERCECAYQLVKCMAEQGKGK